MGRFDPSPGSAHTQSVLKKPGERASHNHRVPSSYVRLRYQMTVALISPKENTIIIPHFPYTDIDIDSRFRQHPADIGMHRIRRHNRESILWYPSMAHIFRR